MCLGSNRIHWRVAEEYSRATRLFLYKTKMKVSKREQNWQEHYAQLLAYVQEHRHLPDKRKVENRGLLNWWKYNRKLILQGKLDAHHIQLLDQLSRMREGCGTD
mgnify:CR=1 FL=1